MAVFEQQVKTLEADIAEVMGVINAAHGRLVELMGEALVEDLWKVWGIHSPGHFLGWQAGMTTARARGIAKIAQRRDEIPTAVAALVAGELSLDAVVEIAKSAPAKYEESITFFAKSATIAQLRRCLKTYAYDDPDVDDKAKPREDERSVSMGTDTNSWWFRGRLPLDEGAVVEQAIKAARDDAYRQARALLPDGAAAPTVTWADGLLSVAETSLCAGEAAFPGSDRYLVHLHLDASPTPDDPTGLLSLHLGPPIPAALRALLTCDCQLRPVYEVHGRPLSVGRLTRVISRRLRRLVEHRDGGCRVPGCDRTTGLEIHHIRHWEHGGPPTPPTSSRSAERITAPTTPASSASTWSPPTPPAHRATGPVPKDTTGQPRPVGRMDTGRTTRSVPITPTGSASPTAGATPSTPPAPPSRPAPDRPPRPRPECSASSRVSTNTPSANASTPGASPSTPA